jgi:hypothetical protein
MADEKERFAVGLLCNDAPEKGHRSIGSSDFNSGIWAAVTGIGADVSSCVSGNGDACGLRNCDELGLLGSDEASERSPTALV